MAKKKALTAAERQRRCREKRKNDPEKVAEVKRKDLERYHARKKLVANMSVREHRIMKRKWQQGNKKRKEKKQMLENLLLNTPAPSPIPENAQISSCHVTPTPSEACSSRGKKKVRRDRTKLYRDNIKLQDKIDQLEKKVRKYKKRLQRKSKKGSSVKVENNSQNENNYKVLSNAIKERYKTVKSRKEKRLIQSLLQTCITKNARMQTQLIRGTLGIDRPLKYKTVLSKHTNLVRKIHQFFLRDDVTRATAGKKETVTHKKNKVQKRFLLDSMRNLHKSFLKENSDLKCHYSYFTKHMSGAADGVGGTLKRQADAIVARGKDIADAFQFFSTLQDTSKIKLFMVTDEDIENVVATIPSNIMPLKGCMQVHQMFSKTCGILSHSLLSCFCDQFCSSHVPKTYRPLPEIKAAVSQLFANENEDDAHHEIEDFLLSDIKNKTGMPRKRFYDSIYSSDELCDEDQSLATYKIKDSPNPPNVTGITFQTLQPDDIHPTKIKDGVHVLVNLRSERNVFYTYAGVAKSSVDEEGDVLVMFLKTVDDSRRLFKLVENDLSDVRFEDFVKILPVPKIIKKGRRQFFEFAEPLPIFEK